jgi:hypothetical protein
MEYPIDADCTDEKLPDVIRLVKGCVSQPVSDRRSAQPAAGLTGT